ncbi:hypothetical protein [Sphingopyxis yananensis]|uniref:hypothetical protein n=1 Tax=Sphingopyxis yananensis TaxID=2886687 RepID=UPI001D0FE63A|nr:hypothetical protein [Sphingopyxis yananensis]MCC2602537.1 hypothetical protein [Sphingopyxis yananensis]
MLSCTIIIPADVRTKANALAEAMGWGENNYTVALSADGAEPATHFGLHAWVHPGFVQLISDADDDIIPAELVAAGYPEADFLAVVDAATWSIRENSDGHFDEAAAALDLHRQRPDPMDDEAADHG